MCVEMDLDFGKYCVVDGSPTTVLPVPRHHSKVGNTKSRANTESNINDGLIKINFSRIDERIKRGSVYQTSEEVMQQQQADAVIGRTKVEFARGNVSIIDSLCTCSEEERSPMEDQRPLYLEKEDPSEVPQCSPTHFHAILKLGSEHGEPFFEFSVNSPEDVYVSKRWEMGNALTWVYTFHRSRKSNAGPSVFKNRKEPSILGDMKVSCCLRRENEGAGDLNDTMLTEFVLYDTLHTRKRFSSRDNASFLPNAANALHVSNEISTRNKARSQPKHSHDRYCSEAPRPEQEILAAVIQLPIDMVAIEPPPDDISSTWKMYVAVPAGRHSSPSDECCGPSPVLDRLRLGGGCDCGGWDMACPLTIFSHSDLRIAESQPPIRRQHPIGLNFQGRKNNMPAFSMRSVKDGKYEVDFHALLSSLQAFSISVAILHAANAATRSAEEQIRRVNCAVADEEKNQNPNKLEAPLAPSFVITPPFSRIGRI